MAFDLSRYASSVSSLRPRTIETVTDEVLETKQRIGEDFMALGNLLNEAKELLPHGEWLPWLAEKVQFSERTAQKFMALARGYEANPQLAADLGSEKAFALLELPLEEREQIAQEGVTVNGKTKSAADLTTREVRQVVSERRAPLGTAQEQADSYLRQREEENDRYWELLAQHCDAFYPALKICGSRQDGIFVLKERFKYAASGGSSGGWVGSAKGLDLYGADRVRISRTWTEVWDMLAVMALQDR